MVSALTKAARQTFSMLEKALKVITILNFLGMVAIFGGGYFGYKYVTSDHFQVKVKNTLMKELRKGLPRAINGQLPITTGPGLDIKQAPTRQLPKSPF